MACVPHLPFEIWDQIALYLDFEDLWLARSLNRCFFHLAMNQRYRSICVSLSYVKDNEDYVMKFQRLKDHLIAPRVRQLVFAPLVSDVRQDGYLPWKAVGKGGLPLSRFNSIVRSFRWKDGEEMVRDVVSSFTNVSSIRIGGYKSRSLDGFLQFKGIITTALTGNVENLTSLSVTTIWINQTAALLGMCPYLPKLSELTITYPYTWKKENDVLWNQLKGDLQAFLTRQDKNLVTLQFHSVIAVSAIDLSPLYQPLKCPKLEKLWISAVDFKDPIVASLFLAAHASTLTSLWVTGRYGEAFPSPDYPLSLPHVQDLVYDAAQYMEQLVSFDGIIHLVRSTATLTSLKILNKSLTYHQWADLTTVGWKNLRHLDIRIALLTVSFFDALSEDFPVLETIELFVANVRADATIGGKEPERVRLNIIAPPFFFNRYFWVFQQFIRHMEQRRYPSSTMKSIALTATGAMSREWQWHMCVKSIGAAFPPSTRIKARS